jgi:hypothetical protein
MNQENSNYPSFAPKTKEVIAFMQENLLTDMDLHDLNPLMKVCEDKMKESSISDVQLEDWQGLRTYLQDMQDLLLVQENILDKNIVFLVLKTKEAFEYWVSFQKEAYAQVQANGSLHENTVVEYLDFCKLQKNTLVGQASLTDIDALYLKDWEALTLYFNSFLENGEFELIEPDELEKMATAQAPYLISKNA